MNRSKTIIVGRFEIHSADDGKVWISVVEGPSWGEGGEFNEKELELAIERFYTEKF